MIDFNEREKEFLDIAMKLKIRDMYTGFKYSDFDKQYDKFFEIKAKFEEQDVETIREAVTLWHDRLGIHVKQDNDLKISVLRKLGYHTDGKTLLVEYERKQAEEKREQEEREKKLEALVRGTTDADKIFDELEKLVEEYKRERLS